MSLESYCARCLDPRTAALLARWYEACGADSNKLWMRRNVDRECARNDIDHARWQEFLRDLAQMVHDHIRFLAFQLWEKREASGTPGSAEDDWFSAEKAFDPIKVVNELLSGKLTHYSLPGRELPGTTSGFIFRYMPLRDFLKHNLWLWSPVAPALREAYLADEINSQRITSKDMVGKSLGQPEYPVWCTNDDAGSLTAGISADEIRNRLGLDHVRHGWLVEIRYRCALLSRSGHSLHAPTFIDASVRGADNYFWVKNRPPGGPDWGHAVHLSENGGVGAAEAVHAPFQISASDWRDIRIRVLPPLCAGPPSCNYDSLLANPNL